MCLVKWSHIAKIYLYPLLVKAYGPAMSIVTSLSFLEEAKGINFGLQYILGGFTFLQSMQSRTIFLTSRLNPEEPQLNPFDSLVSH